MIYLDYQATTPLAPEAFEAMVPLLRDQFANPHSAHRAGRAAAAQVEVARDEIARLLPPGGRLIFTSGATEALNIAIQGAPPGGIVTIATEHAAVLDTAEAMRRQGRDVTILPVDGDGLVDMDAARAVIRPGVALVAAMLVNNEIGVIQPTAALARLAREAGALFLCDAVQGYGRVPMPDGCDMIAISAHKIHGPKGVGGLWLRDGVRPSHRSSAPCFPTGRSTAAPPTATPAISTCGVTESTARVCCLIAAMLLFRSAALAQAGPGGLAMCCARWG